MSEGNLFILSGPSGCGKDTVLQGLFKKYSKIYDNIFMSISTITRKMRSNEREGEKYHFVSVEEFEKMIADDEFIEYNNYLGNYYGTPKKPVFDAMKQGKDVILEIDVNGAKKVKEKYPFAKTIFVLPKSIAVLRHRLEKRGTEDSQTIERRINQAINEIKSVEKYDYSFYNDDLDDAVNDLFAIIRANALTTDKIIDSINEVINNA